MAPLSSAAAKAGASTPLDCIATKVAASGCAPELPRCLPPLLFFVDLPCDATVAEDFACLKDWASDTDPAPADGSAGKASCLNATAAAAGSASGSPRASGVEHEAASSAIGALQLTRQCSRGANSAAGWFCLKRSAEWAIP